MHPKYGHYDEHKSGDPVDVEVVRSHPAIAGTFSIGEGFAEGGLYRIVNSARLDLVLLVAERPDAAFVVDLLNTAAFQLADDVVETR